MFAMIQRARHQLLTFVLLTATLLVVAPRPALAQTTPPIWRDAGSLPYTSNRCFDANHPNIVLLGYDQLSPLGEPGTYARNWMTGETTRLNDRAFQVCEETNGLLFAVEYGPGDQQTWPVYRFTSDDPQPRRVMYQPNYFAHDGTQQVYWLGSNQLLASADGGLTWEQRRLPESSISSLLVSPVDGQALYALATTTQPAMVLTIYASADGGRSWERRYSESTTSSVSAGSTVLATPDTIATPVTTLLLRENNGIGGESNADAVFLSTDGARSFRPLGTDGFFSVLQLLPTSDGLVRFFTLRDQSDNARTSLELTTDGGQSWQPLVLPFTVAPPPSGGIVRQAFAAPNVLLLADSAGTLWHSTDGGRSWQPLAPTHYNEQFSPYLPLTLAATPDQPNDLLVLDVWEAGPTQVRPVSPTNAPTSRYFPETGHNLGGAFKRFWEAHGGLAQFGYPKTEPFREVNPADGRIYTVQYFERNRFEYHPEQAGTQYEVLLGLLGNQLLRQQGWE
jgi:hypothetical protein